MKSKRRMHRQPPPTFDHLDATPATGSYHQGPIFISADAAKPLRFRTDHVLGGDAIDHPAHYTAHPFGVECIDVVEHMNFCRGNAIKYIWRAGLKGDAIEDLKKARWYLDREINRLSSPGGARP